MSDLGLVALNRAGLPSFPGASYQEQLLAGQSQALTALQKYAPDLTFDPVKSDQVIAQINVWETRNADRLEAAFSDSSVETLAADIQLEFSSDTAQAFLIACYTRAAYGLGPWQSDLINQISATWATSDAETRLQVFGAIVKMDQDGFLAQVFNPSASADVSSGTGDGTTQTAQAGFGLGPVAAVAIVVAVIGVAAIFAYYFYATKQLDDNNRMMISLCAQAQASGNEAEIEKCLEAAKGLQQQGLFPGIDAGIGTGLKTAIILVAGAGIVWFAIEHGPELFGRRA